MRYVMNVSIAGVGSVNEIVEADPVIHAIWIEAGYMRPEVVVPEPPYELHAEPHVGTYNTVDVNYDVTAETPV